MKPETSSAAAPVGARSRLLALGERLSTQTRLGRLLGVGRPGGRHWADIAVVPVVLVIFAVSLFLFTRIYRLYIDDGLYLLEGSNLLSGRGLSVFGDEPQTVRGPVFPFIVGLLALVFDRDVGSIGVAVRTLAVVNPFLVYLLIRRLAGPVSALLAAAMVAGFGYVATLQQTLNVDAVMLTFLLGAVVMLLRALDTGARRDALLSGVLLGTAILTKETALAIVPAAVLCALLLELGPRQVAWHYAGLAAVCLPWWIYLYASTGEVYLAGKVSTAAAIAAAVVAVVAVAAAVALSRAPAVRRVLAGDRGRLSVAALVVGAWTLGLSVLVLSTSDQVSGLTLGSASGYLRARVLPATPLWQVMPLAALWMIVKVLRGQRLWALYLALLVLHLPIAVFLLAERYVLPRQWLVMETLMYGALAAFLVVTIGEAVRGRSWTPQREVFATIGVALAALLVAFALVRADVLVTTSADARLDDPRNQLNRAVTDMSAWTKDNVPRDELVTTTFWYAYQTVFLDENAHEWRALEFECPPRSRSLVTEACGLGTDIGRNPPRSTVWMNMEASCGAAALSLDAVRGQMERSGSRYLLLTEDPQFPGLFPAASQLERSGAFRVAHTAYLPGLAEDPFAHGLIMLEATGRAPQPVPATMTPAAARAAIDCRVAEKGESGYAAELRADLPGGIRLVDDPNDRITLENSAEAALLRQELDEVYRASPTTTAPQ